jgi:uncharacterized protein (TIGR00255 family)
VKSMTGYAIIEKADARMRFSLEIKSYNNRYLDIAIQLPSYLSSLELRFRDFLSERIIHGKVEMNLRVRELPYPLSVVIDEKAATAGMKALRELGSLADIREAPSLANLLSLEGILSVERNIDTDEVWAAIFSSLLECADRFDEAREEEGRHTQSDILEKLDTLSNSLLLVKKTAPQLESSIKENLRSRFTEVMGNAIDENRVLAETAVALVKFTINEEISRLEAHLRSFRSIFMQEGSQAKKLDFLCQEMNREVNTIGSKSCILETSQAVILMKDAIENIREQLRNLE